jgi:isopentenyl diphosphate isomerase/L-lactate dehydrogenase-like FMN-dependent dehydrogenase
MQDIAQRIDRAYKLSDGLQGVQRVLERINEELKFIMSLAGARNLKNIDPDVIWH